MGTRSLIGVAVDGGFNVIYNHWDGYPEGVGVELVTDFNNQDAVNALMEKGDGSTLTESYKARGETNVDMHFFKGTRAGFCRHARNDYWGEFVYIWENDVWRCWSASSGRERKIPD